MGPAQMAVALNTDMCAFYPVTAKLLEIETVPAREQMIQAWQETLAGKISPTKGLIVRV
jgi:hypothetical protein